MLICFARDFSFLRLIFFLLSFLVLTLCNQFLSLINVKIESELLAFTFTTSIMYIKYNCASNILLATIKRVLTSLNAINLKDSAAITSFYFLLFKFYTIISECLLINRDFDSFRLELFWYFLTIIYS